MQRKVQRRVKACIVPLGRFQNVKYKYTKHAVSRLALEPPASLTGKNGVARFSAGQRTPASALLLQYAIRTYHNLRAYLLLRNLVRPRRTKYTNQKVQSDSQF